MSKVFVIEPQRPSEITKKELRGKLRTADVIALLYYCVALYAGAYIKAWL